MVTRKFEIRQGKINGNYFSDASAGVKNDQEKIDFFNEHSSSIESDFVDHRRATDSYKEQKEKKLHEKNPNLKELGHSKNPSASECKVVQIKNEDVIDIFSEDMESVTDEGKSSKSFGFSCRFGCRFQKRHESLLFNICGEDTTLDVKQTPLGLTTVSRTLPLGFQDGEISADEVTKEQDSSTVPQRLSVSLMENDNVTKTRYCLKPLGNNFSVEHQVNSMAQKKNQFKICSKSFGHIGEKPIFCKICSKAFTNSYGFGIRTRENPFLAELLSKSFSQMGILKVHEGNCTGEKSFHCKICSKASASFGNLRVYGKIRTGEKSFHCKICSKYSSHSVFTSMASFMNFQSIHLTERF